MHRELLAIRWHSAAESVHRYSGIDGYQMLRYVTRRRLAGLNNLEKPCITAEPPTIQTPGSLLGVSRLLEGHAVVHSEKIHALRTLTFSEAKFRAL